MQWYLSLRCCAYEKIMNDLKGTSTVMTHFVKLLEIKSKFQLFF